MPASIAARTRYFDEFFADAAGAGIRQAVVLASGLDTRAYRLDWPTGMAVFEIDQPAVIEFKTTTLAGLGAEPKADLRPVAVDLREDWSTELNAAGFEPTRPSAWIAEGLFGYLAPESQDRLLDAVTALSAPGSRLGTEAVPNTVDMDPDAARERMREATATWREHGFEPDFCVIKFEGRAPRRRRVSRRARLDVGRNANGPPAHRPRVGGDPTDRRQPANDERCHVLHVHAGHRTISRRRRHGNWRADPYRRMECADGAVRSERRWAAQRRGVVVMCTWS